ncbi:uncharacterized protein LOC143017738 isoform X2 [Oratosquilla oratoria]
MKTRMPVSEDEPKAKKRRLMLRNSKKVDCPAKIIVREIVKFPCYKMHVDSVRRRKSISAQLRKDIAKDRVQGGDFRMYVDLPLEEDHKNHVTGIEAGVLQSVDKRVVDQIYALVNEGICNVDEVKHHLVSFVHDELFQQHNLPASNNRRFFPRRKDIQNHIYFAKQSTKFHKMDQANLAQLVENWRHEWYNTGKIHFLPCVAQSQVDDHESLVPVDSQSLLFVHQTDWQKCLLMRYGNHMCFLDAVHRTIKYTLPIYFVIVKTNVDYQIVGSFIVQEENKNSIISALEVIRDWMELSWNPKYFIVDKNASEEAALSEVFPDTKIFISELHREQAWEQWISKPSNGISKCFQVLQHMRSVAQATTETDLEHALEELKCTDDWKYNELLQQWFQDVWLSSIEKWARVFQDQDFFVHLKANNGLSKQRKVFRHDYLRHHADKSLSYIVSVIIEQYLPHCLEKYAEENTRTHEEKSQYPDIPQFIENCPKSLMNYLLKQVQSGHRIRNIDIIPNEKLGGYFTVKSLDKPSIMYEVNHSYPPFCTCSDFVRFQLPCRHLFAVWNFFTIWSWSDLPVWYKDSPFFNLDEGVRLLCKEECIDASLDNLEEQEVKMFDNFLPQSQVICITDFDGHPLTSIPVCSEHGSVKKCGKLLDDIETLCSVVNQEKIVKAEEDLRSILVSLQNDTLTDGYR